MKKRIVSFVMVCTMIVTMFVPLAPAVSAEGVSEQQSNEPPVGDVNGDGKSNLKDVVALLRYIVGRAENVIMEALDVNGDNAIDYDDFNDLFKSKAGHEDVATPGHTHNPVYVSAKEPTRSEDGNIAHYFCAGCRQYFSDAEANNKLEAEAIVLYATGSVGLEFELSADGKYYSLVGLGTCTDTDLYIPAVYENKPVSSIMLSIMQVFGLRSMHIPASITFIEDAGIAICMDEVHISDLATWCNIKRNALTVAEGYSYDLYHNGQLVTDLVIPDGVKEVNMYTFVYCKSIKSVTIPNSVEFISSDALSSCSGLESITVETGNNVYYSKDNCLIGTATKTLVLGCKNSIIPTDGTVTSIGWSAFRGCASLASINIPDSVTIIGGLAFDGCCAVTNIVIPDGVTSIDHSAFSDCSKLESIIIPNSVTNIGPSAFDHCGNITEFIFDGTRAEWEAVAKGTYWDRDCYFEVQCKDDVVHTPGEWIIDREATKTENGLKHQVCTVCGESINSEVIPFGSEGLEFELSANGTYYSLIGMGTCTDTDLYIPAVYNGKPVLSISEAASLSDSLTSIHIPASISSIFYRNWSSNLQGVYISDLAAWCNIIYEGTAGNPLYKAKNLYLDGTLITELVVPEGVEYIGYAAFYGCQSITSVVLPKSLISVESLAFHGCSNLTDVYIPKNVSFIHGTSFRNCASLESIEVDKDNDYYSFVNGCLIDIINGKLIFGNSEAVIPSDGSVVAIGDYAFYQRDMITDISIPSGITSVGNRAFYGCDALESVVIPNSVTSIGSYAFYRCSNITEFIFDGTRSEWEAVTKGENWNYNCNFEVQCKDDVQTHVHTPGEWITDKEATKTENGSKHQVCAVCGETINSEVIPFTGSVGLEFELSADGTYYSLVGMGTCTDIDLYIPAVYENKPVNGIGLSGIQAFGLRSMHIPASVTFIGNAGIVFGMEEVHISDLTSWCNIVRDAAAYSTFEGYDLYLNGQLVTDLVIPDGVKEINMFTFMFCKSIKGVTIPNSVEFIDAYAFKNCIALESITVATGNKVYYSKDNCLIETATKTLVLGCKNSIIPTDGTVTSIGSSAFDGCTSLTSIDIPDSITSIGYRAFENCTSLERITLPAGVNYIDSSAYSNCTSLVSVTIPNSVTSIESYAFYWCSNITEFIFDGTRAEWDAVTKDSNWNKGCNFEVQCKDDVHTHSLVHVPVVAPTCTDAGNMEYWKCSTCDWMELEGGIATNMIAVILPAAGHTPGEWITDKEATKTEEGSKHQVCAVCGESINSEVIPFIGSEGLEFELSEDETCYSVIRIGTCTDTEIFIPAVYNNKPVTSIGNDAFEGCTGLTSIVIPDSVTSIGNFAFASCYELTSIVIPDSVTNIGTYTFCNDKNLKTVIIPDSVTSIGNGVFEYCSGLTSITIPNSVTSIGSFAFEGCSRLTSIVIPDSVTSIGVYAFSDCSKLTSIIIPDSVTSISDFMFNHCSSLSSITLPSSVTIIGAYAFESCTGLTSIIIPDSVTIIRGYAFSTCSSLTGITLPTGITDIGESAFLSCSSLTSITLPASVTSIGNNPFSGCSNLTDVTFEGTIAEWNAVEKGSLWHPSCPLTVIHCTDGDVAVS